MADKAFDMVTSLVTMWSDTSGPEAVALVGEARSFVRRNGSVPSGEALALFLDSEEFTPGQWRMLEDYFVASL